MECNLSTIIGGGGQLFYRRTTARGREGVRDRLILYRAIYEWPLISICKHIKEVQIASSFCPSVDFFKFSLFVDSFDLVNLYIF